MKKTSIIFLIISLILVIIGLVLKGTAAKNAEKAGIELFRQNITEKGDLVEIVEFSSIDTNKINIDISNADINIIGSADKSYAEIINLNPIEYSAYTNNRAFTIKDDLVDALIGRAEGGNISFNGVRDYIRFEKHNPDKIINIYIASSSSVKIFDISVQKGTVTVDSVDTICDYNISIKKGDFVCKNTSDISLMKANVKEGNVKLDNTYVANTDVIIENGDLEFTTKSNIVYSYNVECETGTINYNTDKHTGSFVVENTNVNGNFKAHVGVGSVSIKTLD